MIFKDEAPEQVGVIEFNSEINQNFESDPETNKSKLKADLSQVTFLCQRCGQIAEKTCKNCKTKIIPRLELPKQEQKLKIVQKYLENPELSNRKIARILDVPNSTVSRVIHIYKTTQNLKRKKGSGRKASDQNQEREKKILEMVQQNPDMLLRQVAELFDTCKSTVLKIKKKYGIAGGRRSKKKKINNL